MLTVKTYTGPFPFYFKTTEHPISPLCKSWQYVKIFAPGEASQGQVATRGPPDFHWAILALDPPRRSSSQGRSPNGAASPIGRPFRRTNQLTWRFFISGQFRFYRISGYLQCAFRARAKLGHSGCRTLERKLVWRAPRWIILGAVQTPHFLLWCSRVWGALPSFGN